MKNTLSLPTAGALHLGEKSRDGGPTPGCGKQESGQPFAARQLSFCHSGKVPVNQNLFLLPLLREKWPSLTFLSCVKKGHICSLNAHHSSRYLLFAVRSFSAWAPPILRPLPICFLLVLRWSPTTNSLTPRWMCVTILPRFRSFFFSAPWRAIPFFSISPRDLGSEHGSTLGSRTRSWDWGP